MGSRPVLNNPRGMLVDASLPVRFSSASSVIEHSLGELHRMAEHPLSELCHLAVDYCLEVSGHIFSALSI